MPHAHYAHPEFGLLCPTPRLRRKLRLGMACLIFALIGGAVLRASNMPPSVNSSSAITAAHRDEGVATSADAGRLQLSPRDQASPQSLRPDRSRMTARKAVRSIEPGPISAANVMAASRASHARSASKRIARQLPRLRSAASPRRSA